MKYPFIIIYKKLHVKGMALFPFMILRERSFASDTVIMNHEMIHHRQQVELLVIPFYFFYLLNYLANRFRYRSHDAAYRNIIFEREAYAKEADMEYLTGRRLFSFLKFMAQINDGKENI